MERRIQVKKQSDSQFYAGLKFLFENFGKQFVLLLILSFSGSVFSQETKVDVVYSEVPTSPKAFSIIKTKTAYKDSVSLFKQLHYQVQKQIVKGYFEMAIDSVKSEQSDKSSTFFVYIHVGKHYPNAAVEVRTRLEDRVILEQVKSKYIRNKPISALDIEKENKKIIRYLEDNGFPYSSVQLDSIEVRERKIKSYLRINKGDLVKIQAVKTRGKVKVSKSFLRGYTGLRAHQVFNYSQIEKLESSFNLLKFAQLEGSPEIKKGDEGLIIIIPLKPTKNNRFDGVLGLASSSPKDQLSTSRLLLTGNIDISLNNVFRQAETLDFKWKRIDTSSQNLQMAVQLPYLFNTQFGIQTQFILLKQSEDYLNSTFNLGLNYYYSGSNYIGLKYSRKQSDILNNSINNELLKDYRINAYGLSFFYSNLNRLFNPFRGFSFNTEVNIGNKSMPKDSLKTSYVEYNWSYQFQYFYPIYKDKHILMFGQKAAILQSESIFENQMYRIGGLKQLRGFMESSIYASSYIISSLEYRFAFETQSAFYVFCDWAWYEKKGNPYFSDYPIGVGLGVFFRTPAGIFTISYALGQKKNEDFSVKNAKVHFGFINKF